MRQPLRERIQNAINQAIYHDDVEYGALIVGGRRLPRKKRKPKNVKRDQNNNKKLSKKEQNKNKKIFKQCQHEEGKTEEVPLVAEDNAPEVVTDSTTEKQDEDVAKEEEKKPEETETMKGVSVKDKVKEIEGTDGGGETPADGQAKENVKVIEGEITANSDVNVIDNLHGEKEMTSNADPKVMGLIPGEGPMNPNETGQVTKLDVDEGGAASKQEDKATDPKDVERKKTSNAEVKVTEGQNMVPGCSKVTDLDADKWEVAFKPDTVNERYVGEGQMSSSSDVKVKVTNAGDGQMTFFTQVKVDGKKEDSPLITKEKESKVKDTGPGHLCCAIL